MLKVWPYQCLVNACGSRKVVSEAIDKENKLVTLKGPEGSIKTVKARNPANLEKLTVGDRVKITYTTALAIAVTEK